MSDGSTVIQYKKGAVVAVSRHFLSREFDCPCSECGITLISLDLVAALERLRNALCSAINITSGYRCEAHQEALRLAGNETAKGVSTHCLGMAADITCRGKTGLQIEDAARSVDILSVGVASTWAHVDMRRPDVRRWVYTS